jgi:hypothetical protein
MILKIAFGLLLGILAILGFISAASDAGLIIVLASILSAGISVGLFRSAYIRR